MVRPAPVEPTLAARSACQPWMPRKQETTSVRESLLILVLTEPLTTAEADAAGLERGIATGVSESVLEAPAQALQLDEAERAYLFA
jgi:hypothetical protein